MLPSEAQIDRDVYLPQTYLFIWTGDFQYPYLVSEEATARVDAKNFRSVYPVVELWLCAGGENAKKLCEWRSAYAFE